MDSRILLNRMRREELLNLAEMERLRAILPRLTARNEVRCSRPVSVIIPTFYNADLKRRSLRHLLAGINESQVVQEVILVSTEGREANFSDLRPLLKD